MDANIMKPLPISEYQRRFFIEWAMRPKDDAYNIFGVYRINGDLDEKRFKRACELFIQQHEEVHASYSQDGSECFCSDYGIDDFYSRVALASDEAAIQYASDALRAPFHLVHQPLLRLHLISSGNEGAFYFVHVAHHIVCDGEMLKIIGEQISRNYNAMSGDQGGDVVRSGSLFRAAVDAESQLLTMAYADAARDYWLEFIGDTPIHVKLPFKSNADQAIISNKTNERVGESTYFGLSGEQSVRIRAFAEARGTTLFVVLAAIYALVLSKYCNQQRFFISYPVNVRPPGCADAGGSFVNNLPMKIEVDKYETLDDLIESLKLQRKSVKEYQSYSFARIVRDQAVENDAEIDSCMNVGFVSTNLRAKNVLILAGIETAVVSLPRRNSIFNFSLLYDGHDAGGIRFRLDHMADLFDRRFVDDFIASFQALMCEAIDRDAVIVVKKYCVTGAASYACRSRFLGADERGYEVNVPIHALFDRQARRTPSAVAVIDGPCVEHTYADLRSDVDRLALRLISSEGVLVGILSEKGYSHAVATLAVMKSGHGYLPLNVEWPMARIVDVLECGSVRTLLVSRRQRLMIESDPRLCQRYAIVDIQGVLEAADCLPDDAEAFYPQVLGSDIAYVIFTSGSTGTPKGVTISHSGALNTIHAVNEQFSVDASDRVLALSDLSFDLSVYDLFGPLFVGGVVVFPEQSEIRSCEYLSSIIHRCGITIWNSVPQLADLLVNAPSLRKSQLDSLRLWLLSGDWIPVGLPADIRRHCAGQHVEVISLGGATEGSIWSVWYPIHDVDPEWTSIPYGRAMPNQKMYILDGNDVMAPVGTLGEICIGGAGVALNYWKDQEKTSASFFEHETLGRLYRTGDCGKANHDGYVEFCGRNDSQVKIRGYRVELGDIEAQLASYPGVRQSVVLARSNPGSRNQYLVGYYVSDHGISETALAAFLSDRLPDYMVPGMLIHLVNLPLTRNGKVDREALPFQGFVDHQGQHQGPENEMEAMLVRFFADVLSTDPVDISVHADFFRRGGDSIAAVRLVGKINSECPDAQIKVIDIFKHKTIRHLSDYISKNVDERDSMIKSMNDSSTDRLLFMIHPATGGCEVYFGLAERLVDQYKCYGIDNHNLHNEDQISDIHALADIYLSCMKSVRREMKIPDCAAYNMTGWSLGGQIAFAIAAILESEGVTDINIISLDAILNDGDDVLQKIRSGIDLNRDAFRKGLEARRIESSRYENNAYIEKILNMVHTEKVLATASIRRELRSTNVLLFKTMKPYLNIEINPNAAELSDHVSRLPYNNVQNVVRDLNRIRVFSLDCDHGTLLREWDDIANRIRRVDWPETVEH
jgi:amino acid adenylation domain-containing protein